MPMGGSWSPVGVSAIWFSGATGYGVGYDWTRHSRNTEVYEDEIVNARGTILHVDGHVEIYSGNFAVDPSYPNAGVRYDSPNTPFPLLTN